ncbi:uncharacterized protein RJT20DRAFT_55345 [Scheffersomyces xylosifermentans]|uniref:uncharacterized protein n=1 Tax=Scheffersomyces xylosifermentans TaxID=1304137 RepID=UPI00315CBABE
MSFVGVIDSNKHKLMWSRAITSLASISEHIKFVITEESLSLSAVNHPKTSHGEIIFKKSFFHEYAVDFSDILPEGFEPESESSEEEAEATASYSFLINSKHLATLFKNLDANDLDYICFKIYWSTKVPAAMKYKFLIEIKTKKLIIKKYQTNYQPVHRNQVKVASIYKAELHQQQEQGNSDNSDERISFIMIEQSIPKQFLDMIPASTEDFKIEVRNEKLSFSGYTKQILKDREYLKQPMSVTITLNLDELVNTNLSTLLTGDEPVKRCINFRLKDFRNFLHLISSFTVSSSDTTEDDYVSLNNLDNNECFEILFKNPGDPVLFELQNNPHVQIQYVQITSKDESAETTSRQTLSTQDLRRKQEELSLHGHTLHRIDRDDHNDRRSATASQFATPSQARIPLNFPRLQTTDSNRPTGKLREESRGVSVVIPSNKTPEPSQNVPSSMEVDDFVTYRKETTPNLESRKRKPHTADLPKQRSVRSKGSERSKKSVEATRKSAADNDATDYSDSDNEGNGSNEDEENEIAFGPTQVNNRPNSIF